MSVRDEIDEIHRGAVGLAGEVRSELQRELGWSADPEAEEIEELVLRAVATETSGIWAAIKVLADRLDDQTLDEDR